MPEICIPKKRMKLEAQWAEPVSFTFPSVLRKLNIEPSIDASHQVSVHLAKQLQRRRFSEIDLSDTRMACGGHFINGWELNAQSL